MNEFRVERRGDVILSSPVFMTIKWAKNWAAILFEDKKTKYKVGRIFLDRKDGFFDVSMVREGDIIEFGSKYVSKDGPMDTKWIGKVVEMTDTEVVFRKMTMTYEEMFEEQQT